MRNPSAEIMDLDSYCLGPGSRSSNDADYPAADVIGKPQPNPVNDRRTAIGSHYKQTFFARGRFQSDFIFQGNIIAVKKNMFAQVKRIARNSRSITTGNRNQNPICFW